VLGQFFTTLGLIINGFRYSSESHDDLILNVILSSLWPRTHNILAIKNMGNFSLLLGNILILCDRVVVTPFNIILQNSINESTIFSVIEISVCLKLMGIIIPWWYAWIYFHNEKQGIHRENTLWRNIRTFRNNRTTLKGNFMVLTMILFTILEAFMSWQSSNRRDFLMLFSGKWRDSFAYLIDIIYCNIILIGIFGIRSFFVFQYLTLNTIWNIFVTISIGYISLVCHHRIIITILSFLACHNTETLTEEYDKILKAFKKVSHQEKFQLHKKYQKSIKNNAKSIEMMLNCVMLDRILFADVLSQQQSHL
jgi:cytochrome c551/c552